MKHILMIDDVTINLRCVNEVLKDEYEVSMAKSGKQAFSLLKQNKPDLILLDISMPEMDGFQVMERLQSSSETKDIPVIFLTGESDYEKEAKCLKVGAMDFIRKPFEPDILLERIRKALTLAADREQLKDSAYKDSLTGIWNRRYFEDYFERESCKPDFNGVFILLDLDNFKSFNDTYGHGIGDKLLEKFSETLLKFSVENAVCSRLGGDEFIFFIQENKADYDIQELAANMIAELEYRVAQVVGEDCEIPVSVSAGIARVPADGKSFETVCNCADKALYHVKQNGKRGYHFYNAECNPLLDISKETAVIDLLQLKLQIRESQWTKGAYRVEYDSFKKIYRFVQRYVERNEQMAQVVLFTLSDTSIGDESNLLDESMQLLEHAVTLSLRRGDVAMPYGRSQYVVILMDTTTENGKIAADRILVGWKKLQKNANISLTYEIQSVDSQRE